VARVAKRAATEVARLVNEFEQAVDGHPWHGESLMTILGRVRYAVADRRLPGAHSIREIVRHLTAWMEEVRSRTMGAPAAEPPGGAWPPAKADGPAAWKKEIAALGAAHRALVSDLAAMSEPDLLQPINDPRNRRTGKGVSRYVLLHGQVQHLAYHAGQIVLLAKLRP